MTLDTLINDMVTAANNYPGIDLITYRSILNSVIEISSVILGIAIVAISVGLPVIVALDLVYINFPPLTKRLLDREMYCQEAGVEKKYRHWGLFLNDARKALRLHAENRKNINACYAKVKWRSILIAVFTLVILISGQETIIKLVMKLLGPILKKLAIG